MRKNDDATPERCCGWPIILALVSVHVDDDEGRSPESSVLLLMLFAFLLHGKLTDPDRANGEITLHYITLHYILFQHASLTQQLKINVDFQKGRDPKIIILKQKKKNILK